MTLVYPEVLRRIFTCIVSENDHTDPDCDDDWPSLWLQLVCRLPGMEPPPLGSPSAKRLWIDRAFEAFCGDFSVLDKFNRDGAESR